MFCLHCYYWSAGTSLLLSSNWCELHSYRIRIGIYPCRILWKFCHTGGSPPLLPSTWTIQAWREHLVLCIVRIRCGMSVAKTLVSVLCACVEGRISISFPIQFKVGKTISILVWGPRANITVYGCKNAGPTFIPKHAVVIGSLFQTNGFAPLSPDNSSWFWILMKILASSPVILS